MKAYLLLLILLTTTNSIQIKPFSYVSQQESPIFNRTVSNDYFKPVTIGGVDYQLSIKPNTDLGIIKLYATFVRNSDFSIVSQAFIPNTEVFCGENQCAYTFDIENQRMYMFWCRNDNRLVSFDRFDIGTDFSFVLFISRGNALRYNSASQNIEIHQMWYRAETTHRVLVCMVLKTDGKTPDVCRMVNYGQRLRQNGVLEDTNTYSLNQDQREDPRKYNYAPILRVFEFDVKNNYYAAVRLDRTTQKINFHRGRNNITIPGALDTGCVDLKSFSLGSEANYHFLAYSCETTLSLVLYSYAGRKLTFRSERKIQNPFPANFLIYNITVEVEANRVVAYVSTSNYLMVESIELTSNNFNTEYRNYFNLFGSVQLLNNQGYPSAKLLMNVNDNNLRQTVLIENNETCLWLIDGLGTDCVKSCTNNICKPCENNQLIDKAGVCHSTCPVTSPDPTWFKFCNDGETIEWQPANDNCNCSSVQFCDSNSCVANCPLTAPYFDHNRYCIACENPFEFYDPVSNECLVECPELFPLVDTDNFCRPCPSATPYYRPDTNECILECPDTFPFSENDTCKLCPSDRKFYNEVTNTCLAKCPDDKPLSDGNFICKACPSNLFYASITNECLTSCPPSQPNSNDFKICFRCALNAPFFSNGACVASCPNSTPFSDEYSICSNCPSATPFYVKSDNTCNSSCPFTIPLYDSDFICQACDPDNSYYDITTNQCLPQCLPVRPNYDENKICRDCTGEMTFYLGTSNTCLEVCPNTSPFYDEYKNCYSCGNFYDAIDNKCVAQCPGERPLADFDKFCQTCSPITPVYDGRNNVCLEQCPELLPFRDSINICQPCGGVAPVYDSNERKCVEACPEAEPNILNGICVQSCGEGFVLDGINCTINCPSERQFLYQGKCMAVCPEEAPYHDKEKNCLLSCPSGSFPETASKACLEVCPNFQKRVQNECVDECPERTPYETNTGLCAVLCGESYPLKVEEFKRCYATECPDSHPYVLDNQCLRSYDNRLVDCSNTIVPSCPESASLTLEYTLDVILNPCKALNPYRFDRCVAECPFGSKRGDENNCVPACNFDEGFVFLNNTCVNCKEKSDLLPFAHDNKCIKECPVSYYGDAFNSCRFCDKEKGEKVLKQSCTRECPLGYIYEESINFCRKLNENCEDDEYSYEGKCYQTCPEGTIMNPDLLDCIKIPASCSSEWCINGTCQAQQTNAHFPTCTCDKDFYGIRCNSQRFDFVLSEYEKVAIYYKTTLNFINEFAETIRNGDSSVILKEQNSLNIFVQRSSQIMLLAKGIKEKLQIHESRQKVFMLLFKQDLPERQASKRQFDCNRARNNRARN